MRLWTRSFQEWFCRQGRRQRRCSTVLRLADLIAVRTLYLCVQLGSFSVHALALTAFPLALGALQFVRPHLYQPLLVVMVVGAEVRLKL